jgi:hypothetical protein
MFYISKETKIEEKAHISKHKTGQLNKKGKSMIFTSSKSRHFIEPFNHDLFPLDVLLISVRKGLLCLLCPSQC